jgi:hypothetical protein
MAQPWFEDKEYQMATNPAIERAQLFAFLKADNPTTLPVFNETTGELQLVATGPNPMDRVTVRLKAKRQAELLNFAPIEWWQTAASTNGLIDAINNRWISVPPASSVPQAPVLPAAPEEQNHFLVKWLATSAPQLSSASEARMYFNGTTLLLSENGSSFNAVVPPVAVSTLTYGASVALDFDNALPVYRTISLTGDLTLTSANLGPGRQVSLRIVADGSTRSFTFPGWTFIGGAAPASIAASKTGILSLVSYGVADADVVAAYSVEP